MIATVRALHRFPVKGFPGERVETAQAAPGTGLKGDRVVALADGSARPEPGAWQRWSAFLALKKRSDLASWKVTTLRDGRVRLTPPEGHALTLDPAELALAPSSASHLRSHFAADPPLRPTRDLAFTAAREQGMFDDRDGHLSLISAESVRALGSAAGVEIDPLRFRGNLLIEGMPAFAETRLVGSCLRIGDAVVRIRSTIERCAATKVNPASARSDLNVPRLLATHLGHIHMGVYGEILSPGAITTGDPLELLDEETPSDSLALPTGPVVLPAGTGPRSVRVLDGGEIEAGRTHLRLHDAYGWFSAHWQPGMHVRVHLAGTTGPLWRSYTACLVNGSEFSLLTERRGEATAALSRLRPGDSLLVSGPFGGLTADSVSRALTGPAAHTRQPEARTSPPDSDPPPAAAHGRDVAVLTAGAGITTALSLLPGITADCTVRCLHVDRGAERASVAALMQLAPAGTVTSWDTALRGRPGNGELAAFLTGASAAVLSGSEAFVASARAAADTAGVPVHAVFSEAFASPGRAQDRITGRPAATILRADGRRVAWTPEDGTLLEALEADGAQVPYTCRSGSCGTCSLSARGRVEYVLDHTAQPAPGSVLSCCAVPVGEVQVEV